MLFGEKALIFLWELRWLVFLSSVILSILFLAISSIRREKRRKEYEKAKKNKIALLKKQGERNNDVVHSS